MRSHIVRVVCALGLAGCANSVTVIRASSPADMAPNERIVAIDRSGQIERVCGAIGVFGVAPDAYVLTTGGHVPLAARDRVVVVGTYYVGQRVPGGGFVGRGPEPALLVFGGILATGGVALGVGGAVAVAQPTRPDDWFALRSVADVGLVALIATGGLVAVTGAAVVVTGSRTPRFLGGDDGERLRAELRASRARPCGNASR